MIDKSIKKDDFQIFCGQGRSAQFSVAGQTPACIGIVTVDSRKLCKSKVKIKFSSIVNLIGIEDVPLQDTILTFQLFKSCENEEPVFLDSWVYEAAQLNDTETPLGLSTSFSFIFCDSSNCSRLCEYFVEVSVESMVSAAVLIDNVQIQAILHPRLLSCGQGMNAVFPSTVANEPIIPDPSSATIGQVTVNTKGLSRSVVEIEFSSIVNLIAADDDAKASLNFQLFRACDEEQPILVDNFIYEVFNIEDVNNNLRLSTSFSFSFCEALKFNKCCDYFVVVSVGGLEEIESISVTDVHIAALTGESGECKKNIERGKYKSLGKYPMLSCGQSNNIAFTNADIPSIIVGSVEIDTRNICNPRVSIEFSSIVSFLSTGNGSALNSFEGSSGQLNFELFRVCHNDKPVLLNNWIYEFNQVEDVFDNHRFIDSFEFNFCDDSAVSGCCEYFVKVSIENLITAIILVDNVYITALAGEGY